MYGLPFETCDSTVSGYLEGFGDGDVVGNVEGLLLGA